MWLDLCSGNAVYCNIWRENVAELLQVMCTATKVERVWWTTLAYWLITIMHEYYHNVMICKWYGDEIAW